MYYRTISMFTSFLLFWGFLDRSSGQLLTAEYLTVKLPNALYGLTSYYDGEDGIYLFGGIPDTSNILVYSISQGTLEMIGKVPGHMTYGSVQSDNYGNIFYFGGSNGNYTYSQVSKIDIVANRSNVVDVFPNRIGAGTSIKYNDTVYVLGGNGQVNSGEVLAFNIVTLNHSIVASTPFATYPTTSVRVGNKAYVFGRRTGLRTALELDLETLQMAAVGPSTIPLFAQYCLTSVWDGTFAYIIGGYESTGAPTGGIIQFNPVTLNNAFLPVRNFHVEGLSYFPYPPTSVFVPSLNKIYGFGGRSFQYNASTGTYDSKLHDEIFFIDLTPLSLPTTTTITLPTTTTTPESTISPTTTGIPVITTLNPDFFSCTNRTNGLYPHPTDCSQFIGCQNGDQTFFSCTPFLFDPLLAVCTFPEEVACGTSCVDKVDGYYPHPHDCALYVICRSWVATIFKCPPPLLFNPERFGCAYPDEVQCSFDF